jgi:hypothetical protein
MSTYFDHVNAAAAWIHARIGEVPDTAVVLGSGLGAFAEGLAGATGVAYEAIPHWPPSRVAGHPGRLVAGTAASRRVLALSGRVHFYEGHDLSAVTFAVRVLGRLDPRVEAWPVPLEDLAARHGARWAMELPTGSLEALADRFAERLAPEQDFLAQLLELVAVAKELEAERALSVWPWRLGEWPVPRERAVRRAFDLLCPDEKAIVLGVFEGGELATCLVARRKGNAFDSIVGPDELRGEMGILSGDFRRDHRHLVAAAERRLAPVALGCFAELATLKALAGAQEPGAWARAVAAQDVVIAPWMPGVAVPLGLDVGRVALRGLKALAESFGAAHLLSREGPIAQVVLGMERPPWLDQDLRVFLGFDPLKLLGRLLSRDLEL